MTLMAALFLNMAYNLTDSLWIGNLPGETAHAHASGLTAVRRRGGPQRHLGFRVRQPRRGRCGGAAGGEAGAAPPGAGAVPRGTEFPLKRLAGVFACFSPWRWMGWVSPQAPPHPSAAVRLPPSPTGGRRCCPNQALPDLANSNPARDVRKQAAGLRAATAHCWRCCFSLLSRKNNVAIRWRKNFSKLP